MDIQSRVAELRRRINNVKSTELQRLAEAAGWSPRKGGKHITYVKGGRSFPIPTHARALKANTIRRILDRIEADYDGESD